MSNDEKSNIVDIETAAYKQAKKRGDPHEEMKTGNALLRSRFRKAIREDTKKDISSKK